MEKPVTVEEFFARARSCIPSDVRIDDNAVGLRLAVESVRKTGGTTQVRLVAYSIDRAIDFYLPIYRLSAGRWLINDKGRAYLLDEQCREHKLNDRKPSASYSSDPSGKPQIPHDGRIRLNPGQAFETTLVFPPLPDETRIGALVYEGNALPFILHSETRNR